MSEHSTIKLFLADLDATNQLGAALAPLLQPGMVIFFKGELAAGKTSLVRAMLRSVGITEHIKSPSYALVEAYTVSRLHSTCELFHFDFYRLNSPAEWEEAGFREYFNDQTICLVEWPEKAEALLPAADVSIYLSIAGEGRKIEIMLGNHAEKKCTKAGGDIRNLISALAN